MALNCAQCRTPCTCVVADDGIIVANNSYVLNSGKGRRSTVVSGTGTAANPYTVSFIDSEFYRPQAGEFQYPDQNAASIDGDLLDFTNGAGVVSYQTPNTIFFNIASGMLGDFSTFGFFQVVGASATFASNTTGSRSIRIEAGSQSSTYIVAGYTTDVPAEDFTLSCAGFFPGLFTSVPSSPIGFTTIKVRVSQDSGGTLALTNIKFWVGTL